MKRIFPWLALLLGLPLIVLGGMDEPLDCPEFKSLCIQAEKSGNIDLNLGTAVLKGNVIGYIKEKDLKFFAQTVKAFRNKNNQWERLELDRQVRIIQPDSNATADHSIIEKEKTLLFGNAKMNKPPHLIEGEEIIWQKSPDQTSVKGSKNKQARIQYMGPPLPPEKLPDYSPGSPKVTPAIEINDIINAKAHQALIDNENNSVQLIGKVSVVRKALDWNMKAETVLLHFGKNKEFTGFRAEGGVVINQPDRSLSSDIALSQNNNETVLLIGNAKIKQLGQFELTSDRIEVFTDAKKGIVRGEEKQKPITLSFDIPKNQKYILDRPGLETLASNGLPSDTKEKLLPILDRPFKSAESFSNALGEVLTDKEMDEYSKKIIKVAQ